jgi:mannose-6-phosphate isomerase-like protein (cupin superfamily)
MVRPGDAVENPQTGERIVFVKTAAQTRGELLEMDDLWPDPDHRTLPHVHPGMEERWEVVEGRAGFRIGDDEHEIGPGESVTAPPGTVHSGWNASGGPTRLRIQMRPALRWEDFVVRLFAGDDMMALLRDFPDEIAPPPA